MTEPLYRYTYVARKPCGCPVAAVADLPKDPKFTARAVADFVRSGLTIERILSSELPPMCHPCPHDAAVQTALALELAP